MGSYGWDERINWDNRINWGEAIRPSKERLKELIDAVYLQMLGHEGEPYDPERQKMLERLVEDLKAQMNDRP